MTKSVEELQELAESDVGESSGGESDDASADGATDAGSSETVGSGTDGQSGGLRGRLPTPSLPSVGSGPVFAPRRFLVALGLAVAGLVVGGAIPFVGMLTQYVGLFAGAFVLGLASSRRSYTEVGVAGAVAAAVSLLLGTLTTGGFVVGADLLGRYGLTVTGVGVAVGLLVSLVGHYFGRDLRAGVTRDVGSE